MKVFKPSRFAGIVFALTGVPFALVGVGGLAVGFQDGRTWQDWDGYLCFYCFYLAGSFCAITGLALFAYRIEMDSHGMSRLSWFGIITYRDSWKSLKSWTTGKIEDEEIPGRFYVEFDFQGRRWPFRIEASMVFNPGVSGLRRCNSGLRRSEGIRNDRLRSASLAL